MPDFIDVITRIWDNLLARPSGPFAFRFILQPLVAAGLAIRDGLKDARAGRSPYLWLLFTEPHGRPNRVREGLAAVGRVIGLSVVMDAAYQLMTFGWIYPFEVILITLFLAILPYFIIRGPANRIAQHFLERRRSSWSHR